MESLPIVLHRILNAHHRPSRLQSADAHMPLYISCEHLILESTNRLLEGLTLALEPLIAVDLGPEGSVTELPEGFIHVIVAHVVSVEKPKDVGGDERRWNVHVDYRCRMNLAMVGGSVKG
jgi:hypothetical protein